MAGDMDIKAHNQTYAKVMSFMKWGTAATVVITALVIWLIA